MFSYFKMFVSLVLRKIRKKDRELNRYMYIKRVRYETRKKEREREREREKR